MLLTLQKKVKFCNIFTYSLSLSQADVYRSRDGDSKVISKSPSEDQIMMSTSEKPYDGKMVDAGSMYPPVTPRMSGGACHQKAVEVPKVISIDTPINGAYSNFINFYRRPNYPNPSHKQRLRKPDFQFPSALPPSTHYYHASLPLRRSRYHAPHFDSRCLINNIPLRTFPRSFHRGSQHHSSTNRFFRENPYLLNNPFYSPSTSSSAILDHQEVFQMYPNNSCIVYPKNRCSETAPNYGSKLNTLNFTYGHESDDSETGNEKE